jgi:hypothetical protein
VAASQAKESANKQGSVAPRQRTVEQNAPSVDGALPGVLNQLMANPSLARPESILRLQRTVGNRAVNSLLGRAGKPAPGGRPPVTSSVQRMPRPTDIHGYNDRLGRTSKTVKGVRKMLADYHVNQSPGERLWLLQATRATADHWIKKHGTGSQTAADFQALISQADNDIPQLASKLVKQGQLRQAGEAKGGGQYLSEYKTQFGYRGRSAQEMAQPQAGYFSAMQQGAAPAKSQPEKMKMGLATDSQTTKNVDWLKKYQLSEAELTAIKTYTAGTYRIINAALTGDEGYLKAMVTNTELDLAGGGETPDTSTAGLDKATKEAWLHAGQIDKAIDKITAKEAWTGTTYRGETYPLAQMEHHYQSKHIKFLNYVSTSKDRTRAEKFMKDAMPNANRPLGILWKISVSKGADIEDVSIASHEKEVLLPRNSRFELSKRSKKSDPNKGPWWEVEARQAT